MHVACLVDVVHALDALAFTMITQVWDVCLHIQLVRVLEKHLVGLSQSVQKNNRNFRSAFLEKERIIWSDPHLAPVLIDGGKRYELLFEFLIHLRLRTGGSNLRRSGVHYLIN